jgi:prostaglandin-E synthase
MRSKIFIVGSKLALSRQLKCEADKVVFDGEGADGKKYHVVMNLFGEIDPEQTKELKTGLHTELVLMKKEEGPFWPRLLKEKGKAHFLKVCDMLGFGSK